MTSNSIHQELKRLNEIDSSYNKRRAIESLPTDEHFTAQVTIEKIDRSYGYIREEGFRDGKTIIGKLNDADQELKLLFPQVMNGQVENWTVGQIVTVNVSFHEFDSAYKRYQMLVRNLVEDDRAKADRAPQSPPPQIKESSASDHEHSRPASTIPAEPSAQETKEVTNTTETPVERTTNQESLTASNHENNEPEKAEEPPEEVASEAHIGPATEAPPEPAPLQATENKIEDLVDEDSLQLPPPIVDRKQEQRQNTPTSPKPAATQNPSKSKRRRSKSPKFGRSKTKKRTAASKKKKNSLLALLCIVVISILGIGLFSYFEGAKNTSERPRFSYSARIPDDFIYLSAPQKAIDVEEPDVENWASIPTRAVWKRVKLSDNKPIFTTTINSPQGHFQHRVALHPKLPLIVLIDGEELRGYSIGPNGPATSLSFPQTLPTFNNAVSFTPDGKSLLLQHLFQASEKLSVYDWPIQTDSEPEYQLDVPDNTNAVFHTPIENLVFVSMSSNESTQKQFNLAKLVEGESTLGTPLAESLTSPSFTSESSQLITMNLDRDQLTGHDLEANITWQSSRTGIPFKMHSSVVNSHYIATINLDKQLRIYQLPHTRPYWALNGMTFSPSFVTMAPNSTHVALIPNPNAATIWILNFLTGEVTAKLASNDAGKYLACYFNGNSRYLYAVSDNKEIHFWEIKTSWIPPTTSTSQEK